MTVLPSPEMYRARAVRAECGAAWMGIYEIVEHKAVLRTLACDACLNRPLAPTFDEIRDRARRDLDRMHNTATVIRSLRQ